jgi:teichuronic acid biosynthesis glycosyltransferase TuaH
MRDLIFVSMEDWDDVWRRNQFVCAELARRHPQSKVLFVGLSRNLSRDLRHGRIAALRKQATVRLTGFTNIVVTHPLKLLPDTLAWGRKLNEQSFRRHVQRVARGLGMIRPILWLNPHYAVHMVGRMGEGAVVYDVTDDWISLNQAEAVKTLVIKQDAELCAKADATIVCSQKLHELKKGSVRELYLIPNGVDAEHYRCVLEGTGPLPDVAKGWPKPVIGYTGTIQPDRLDVPLVVEMARQMTGGSIVLVGPNLLPPADAARLAECGNVFLPGVVSYREIPEVMRAFDVCIVPHKVTPFTESLNPIKLWEYLAAGKPVVSTEVAGFRDFPDLVRLARTAEGLLAAAHEAIAAVGTAEGNARAAQQRAVAREHSWERRIDEIEKVFERCRRQRQVNVSTPDRIVASLERVKC